MPDITCTERIATLETHLENEREASQWTIGALRRENAELRGSLLATRIELLARERELALDTTAATMESLRREIRQLEAEVSTAEGDLEVAEAQARAIGELTRFRTPDVVLELRRRVLDVRAALASARAQLDACERAIALTPQGESGPRQPQPVDDKLRVHCVCMKPQ